MPLARCVPRKEASLRGPEMTIWPVLDKNLPWGTVLKFSQRHRQLLVEVRRGAGTCEDPCILRRVLDSAFMQDRVRLGCSDSLIYTGLHTFRRHASLPRAVADGDDWTLVRFPREDFLQKYVFQKSSGQILPLGPLREASPPGYATRGRVFLTPISRRVRLFTHTYLGYFGKSYSDLYPTSIHYVHSIQSGEDPQDALSCRSLSAKEPLRIGLFCGKWPVKIRHPMGLRHPVPHAWISANVHCVGHTCVTWLIQYVTWMTHSTHVCVRSHVCVSHAVAIVCYGVLFCRIESLL